MMRATDRKADRYIEYKFTGRTFTKRDQPGPANTGPARQYYGTGS